MQQVSGDLIRCNLHHRSRINFPRIQIVIDNSPQHDRPRHQTAKIHMRRIRIHRLREKAKDEDNDPIPHRKSIQQDPPNPRDVEGSPDEFVGVPGGAGHLVGMPNGAADTVPEEESFGEGVGGVEGADAEGDDVIEGGGGADVDETDDAGNGGHDEDCVHRDGRIGTDFGHGAPEGQSSVSTEGENDAGRGG